MHCPPKTANQKEIFLGADSALPFKMRFVLEGVAGVALASRRSWGTWFNRLCLLQALVSHHRGNPLKGNQATSYKIVSIIIARPVMHKIVYCYSLT